VTLGANTFIQIHGVMMLTGVLVCVICALLGNYLVLRRQSLLGDAVSHSVLPGIVIAFLLFGVRSPAPMFVGAAVAGVSASVVIEVLRRAGRIEPGAAMAVVFTIYFSLGVILLEQAAARHVDLDADCVLLGQLEDLALRWQAPAAWGGLLSVDTLGALPRQTRTLMGVLMATLVFISLLYKELRITSFDPQLATALGINATVMQVTLIVFVAAAVVASFEAVGSILVIAMLIAPPATARLLTDRLGTQIALSVVIAVVIAIAGHSLAVWGPPAMGLDLALASAPTMATVAGILLIAAVLGAPTHGVIARRARSASIAARVAREDMLAMLLCAEQAGRCELRTSDLLAGLATAEPRRWVRRLALHRAARGDLVRRGASWSLTEPGRETASEIIHSHHLWEHFLTERLGLRPDHVHATAMRLEHLRRSHDDRRLTPEHETASSDPRSLTDPHRIEDLNR